MGAVCVIVLCITLSLGLWPFYHPRNDVTWTPQAGGLAFGEYGTVFSSGPLMAADRWSDSGGSIEMWIQPDRSNSATILALYRPEKSLLVTLAQSETDLELNAEFKNDSGARVKWHFYQGNAFVSALRKKKAVFITVTCGPAGTKVYLDGTLVETAPNFWIPQDAFRSRLIVGDSPGQPDSFSGLVRGLAIYGAELNGAQIRRHYENWIADGRPDVDQTQYILALYLFNEKTGDTVRNQAGADGDLHIPERYMVIDKVALEPFWTEFNASGGYWRGNLKNIVGFIPLGFCFYAYFAVSGLRGRALLITIMVGALVSLTIEILQAALPTRDSGTTDLITNTIGTWVGVLCYQKT